MKPTSWKKYLANIDKALAEYKGCKNEKIGCYKQQIEADFKIWKDRGGITKEDFDTALQRKVGEHYQIINHRLYRQENCIFPFRCSGNEHFVLKIIKKLPDMELIINSHDWPKSMKRRITTKRCTERIARMEVERKKKMAHWNGFVLTNQQSPLTPEVPYYDQLMPVLSFSKTPSESDIIYPAWTFWEGGPAVWPIYPTGLGRWDIQIDTISKAAREWPWEKKENKAFFRGSRTSSERDPLVLLSRESPDLADAQYTKNQAWKSNADTLYAPPAKEIPLEEHCKYKYLFNFRGVAASFRFKHLFLCDSVVFHVGDEWKEFFYPAMKPWVHYIPLQTDLSNARDLIEFARANDDVVREIAKRGRKFILSHLRLNDVEEYWKQLLKKYANLMKWKPERNKNLVEIRKDKKDEL